MTTKCVWVVVRYWLSRRTGEPDFATVARVAAFLTATIAAEYAASEEERLAAYGGPVCRFGVLRCDGSLADFAEGQRPRSALRLRRSGARDWRLPPQPSPSRR